MNFDFYNIQFYSFNPQGWLEDWTGNWIASFYTMGGLLITSSICVFIERTWCKSKDDIIMEVNVDSTDIPEDVVHTDEETETTEMLTKNEI